MLIHTSVLVAKYPRINFPSPPIVDDSSLHYAFSEVCFVMRLEERFEGVPDEILVHTSKFGYFGEGDEVILQGKIFKTYLSQWGRQMFTIEANHFYNESLKIGDRGLTMGVRALYGGMMRGSVTKESKTALSGNEKFYGNYFVIRLEENIGIEGIPSEILVHCHKQGYFGKGDKVILQGIITKKVLKKWGRPSYTIHTDHFYNKSLQIGEEESIASKRTLHKCIIRGSVTRESITRISGSEVRFSGTYFVMKLEESFEEVPDEILVKIFGFGYFGEGDKVILQGRILEANLGGWNRPMYLINANHFYNESLQFGDAGLANRKRVLYNGLIRGSVVGESRTRITSNANFGGAYFAVRLEGDIRIEGIPDKLLVRSERAGYFRIGDKVILQGRILEINLRSWNRPMYLINADHYYNESLQIGD
jgi:hypothetical protein